MHDSENAMVLWANRATKNLSRHNLTTTSRPFGLPAASRGGEQKITPRICGHQIGRMNGIIHQRHKWPHVGAKNGTVTCKTFCVFYPKIPCRLIKKHKKYKQNEKIASFSANCFVRHFLYESEFENTSYSPDDVKLISEIIISQNLLFSRSLYLSFTADSAHGIIPQRTRYLSALKNPTY